jgi:phosphoribosylformylglycinamidine synthase
VTKIGVVVFPGSNCDHDALHAINEILHIPAESIWHQSQDLSGFDAVILPGGFSYGDYLRSSPVPEGSSSAFAMAFRFSAKPGFCPAL